MSKARAGRCLGTGIACMGKADYKGAINHFNKALAHDPEYAPAYINRGICHSMQESFDCAVSDFKSAIALGPDRKNAHFNLAATYYRAGEFDIERRSQMYGRSIAEYERTLALDQADAGARINMGNVHGLMKDYEKAIGCYNAALEIDPSNKTAARARDAVILHIGRNGSSSI